jgi:superfamily I DNA/RNA helicase
MVLYIDAEKWEPIDNFTLEPAANEAVKSKSNYLVVAGPGAGKTELLAQRASYLLQTRTCIPPRMILALSYKKDAEKNLRERVSNRVGGELASRFVSLTYDAFAKNILDRFRSALPDNYRPNLDYQIENINKAYETMFDVKLSWSQKLDLFGILVRDIKPLPISNPRIKVQMGKNIEEIWMGLVKGVPGRTGSTLTFPTISILAEYIIRTNQRLKNALKISYSHVFLDEFQDTTQAQYFLVRTCFSDSHSIVTTAVGDERQRIMTWAGAYSRVFESFQDDFRAAKTTLLMNYRSAPRLTALQKDLMSFLFGENDPIIHWNNSQWQEDKGKCEVWVFDDDRQEAQFVAQQVHMIIDQETITPRDVCVIVRQRPPNYCDLLIEELTDFDIHARIENDYQNLLSEELLLILVNLIELAISTRAPKIYQECVDFLKILKGTGANIDIDNKVRELEKELAELQSSIKTCISEITDKGQLHNLLTQILNQIGLSTIISVMTQYRDENHRNNLIEMLTNYLWEEYQKCDDWAVAIKDFRGEDALPIMTIHKSKGLEYNTVIFIGLEDSAFWNFDRASEEETRNFFVAFSRAKQNAIFTFSKVRNKRPNVAKNIRSLYDALLQSKIVEVKDHRTSS